MCDMHIAGDFIENILNTFLLLFAGIHYYYYYCYYEQVKEDEMVGTCGMHGTNEKFKQNFGQNPKGDRSHGRLKHRREDNIEMGI